MPTPSSHDVKLYTITVLLACAIVGFLIVSTHYIGLYAGPPGRDAATFVTQSVPQTLTTGQTVTVSVTMKNTGTSTWSTSGGYELGSQNPANNSTWGISRVGMPGTVMKGQRAVFSFPITAPANPGTYNLQWQMFQRDRGWFGSPSANVSIVVTAPAPVADAGTNVVVNEGASFTLQGSVTGGRAPLTYAWNFGDGTNANVLQPTKTYADNGVYVATLTVTDANGQTGADTVWITVANAPPASVIHGNTQELEGFPITLRAVTTDPGEADENAGFRYLWDFGDGTQSTSAAPTHTYAEAGTHIVTLTTTDKDGWFTATTATTVINEPQPNSTFATRAVDVNGQRRIYSVQYPLNYGTTQNRYPLVFGFHGGGQTTQDFQLLSLLNVPAVQGDFIAVFPAGLSNTWSDGRGVSAAEVDGIDDVAFFRRLAADFVASGRVDPKRIYATGVSNGGILTYRLACEAADVLAGIAPVAAGLASNLASSCLPAVPLSLVIVEGTADQLIPFNGGLVGTDTGVGEGGYVESYASTHQRFAAASRCAMTPSVTNLPPEVVDGTSVTHTAYNSCANGMGVSAYAVVNGGHRWPPSEYSGGWNADLLGTSSQNISTTQVILDYLLARPKP